MTEPICWYENFLARLSPDTFDKLLAMGTTLRFGPSQTIFREGDPANFLYMVKTGHVALEMHIPSKGRRTFFTVGPGELFSWSALVEPRIETASARAMEGTEVLAVPADKLLDCFENDHKLGFELYRMLAELITIRLIATRLQLIDTFVLV